MSNPKTTPNIIYYRESVLQSAASDFISFSFIAVLFWFNHIMLDDNKVSGFFFFIVFIIFVLSRASAKRKTFTSMAEMHAYLVAEERKPDGGLRLGDGQ